MELVYLWVEEYKNIQKQEFKLSSKYNINYKDNNLIIENKKHTSIFPKNINITAIVGENGSGKSSLIKLLIFFFLKKHHDNNLIEHLNSSTYNEELQNTKAYLIVKNKHDNFKYISIGNGIPTINRDNIEELEEIDFYTLYTNYTLEILKDNFGKSSWIDHLYHKSDKYNTPILFEPSKKRSHLANSEDEVSLKRLDFLTKDKLLNFYDFFYENNINNLKDFFIANSIKFNFSIIKVISKFNYVFRESSSLHGVKIENFTQEKQGTNEYFRIYNLLYVGLKLCKLEKQKGKFGNKSNISQYIQNIEQYLTQNNFDVNTILKGFNDYEKIKIKRALNFHKYFQNNLDDFQNFFINNHQNKKVEWKAFKKYFFEYECIPPWIEIHLYQDEKSFYGLSNGQKQLLYYISTLAYQINNIKEKGYKTINLYLDELEVGLHPNWQRKFIKNIVDIITSINIDDLKINIITLTHSPFIISDIPKENVIFMKKGKNETKNIELNTFGANIHTLLSHGFFMSDGLMGEFAKGKIEEIKKFYELVDVLKNKDNTKDRLKKLYVKRKKRFNYIASIIGEPFLQTIIKNYLDELEQLFDKEVFKNKKVDSLIEQFGSKEKLIEYIESKDNG